LLNALDATRFDLVLTLLDSANFPWSAEITRRAMSLLAKRLVAETQQWSLPANTLTEWSRRANVAVATQASLDLLAICPDKSPWRNALEVLQDVIDFRAAMTQELMT
jgi:hypothetical protein